MRPSLIERVRRDWASPDLTVLVSVGALLAIGLVMIQSSTVTQAAGAFLSGYFLKQLVFSALGIALAAAIYHKVSMDMWRRASPYLLLLGAALLVAVHVPGLGVSTKEGVNRWLLLGSFTFQPVEAVKLFLILYVAAYCARRQRSMHRFGMVLPVGAICAALALLLLAQPDYGSAVILCALAAVILFVSGVRLLPFFSIIAGLGAAAAAFVLTSPYRLARVTSFWQPFDDPLGAGYHQTHSLMAFGRGGWTGTGLGLSVEKWSHLPEAHNDFIISVVAEELGFIGLVVVVALYATCIVRCVIAAEESSAAGNHFVRYVLIGIASLLALQVFINVGGNLAILPAKGLTLPLVSYGGSSLLASLVMVAVALRAVRESRASAQPERREKYRRLEPLPWSR